jgi:hypothetical protein
MPGAGSSPPPPFHSARAIFRRAACAPRHSRYALSYVALTHPGLGTWSSIPFFPAVAAMRLEHVGRPRLHVTDEGE